MRDLFPEFNKPSEAEFKKMWAEATFVYDTNVLLSLYRLPQKIRKKLLAIFEKLKDRAWIPHQVAMEYYRKRVEVIHDQEKAYNSMFKLLDDSEKKIKEQLDQYSKNPFVDCKRILKKISANHKAIKLEMDKSKSKHPDWLKDDAVEEQLNKIFKNCVGPEYDEKQLQDIYQKGQARYDKEIPPGYKDKEKDKTDKTGTKKYGDLIVWFQIIAKAKESNKPIIFITDEQKEDWWWKVGGTTIGARHELIKEIKMLAGIAFHMYQTDKFMEYASEALNITVGKELIDEIKKLQEESTKREERLAKSESGLSVSSQELVGVNDNLSATSATIGSLTESTQGDVVAGTQDNGISDGQKE
jgi:hypothetical protein